MYERKPKWWTLYLLFPLMVGALFLVHVSGWAANLQSGADLAVILASFSAMAVWMRANEGAIERYEAEQTMRARSKSYWGTREMRSRSYPAPKPLPSEEQLPHTGFGSARNKPAFSAEKKSFDRVHFRREMIERRVNSADCRAEREH